MDLTFPERGDPLLASTTDQRVHLAMRSARRQEGVVMGAVMVRSLDEPDETRAFPNGAAQMVTVGSMLLGRARMEPGWRWSNDVKPIAGTDQCMVLHKGYCVSGALVIRAEDGTETRIHAGDGYVIEPGHDAWVDGDEAYVGIDVSEQMKDYAKPK